jgi:hypothetical protein
MTGTGGVRSRPAPGVAPSRTRILVIFTVAFGAFAALSLTPPGKQAMASCHWFLDFYGGVFSLVALSLTVMGGLAATDRLILLIRHRVLLQAIHRATAATAIGFLVVHILMKLVSGHVRPLDVVVPFLAHHRAGFVGLGTLAAYLMIVAAWTGVVRGRFAGISRPALWRVLHCSAYVSWPIAIVHGLASGRSAAGWVTASYVLCMVAVGLLLAIRLSVHWGRKQSKGSTSTTLPRVGASRRTSRPPLAVPLVTSGPPRAAPVSPAVTMTGSMPRVYDPVPQAATPEPLVDYSGRHAPAPQPRRVREIPLPVPEAAEPIAAGKPAPPADADRRPRPRAADTAPPAARTFESVSDEEFWSFMRGERR